MKKILCCILAAVLLTASLSGCKPTLRAAIEAQMKASEKLEFDLSACFSEEEGYHYPGSPWGLTAREFQERNYYPIQKAVGYGVNGEGIYQANLGTLLLGRGNDDAQLAVNKDDYVYMTSYMFSADGAKSSTVSQSALYDGFLAKLTEAFGEPDSVDLDAKTEDNVTTNYETCHWDYTTADGKETQLQFSKAYTLKGAEPVYISFGFVWINGDPVDEETE